MQVRFLHTIIFFLIVVAGNAQHEARQIHYKPIVAEDGTAGFELVNGRQRFNRAIYGTNTGFRVEAGDLPEFAMYMPGMGGNLKFGLIAGTESKWLIDATQIKTRYRSGWMEYEISDPLLKGGRLHVTVNALAKEEGMILRVHFSGIKTPVRLFWAYGGATGKRFSREGDIGADPESSFYLQPEYCKDNHYSVNSNSFILKYGAGADSVRKRITGIVPTASDIRVVDAARQESPLSLYQSKASAAPVIAGTVPVTDTSYYFLLQAGEKPVSESLAELFSQSIDASRKLAGRIEISTPDPYINSLNASLSFAADAIWEHPTFLHGAVAWRMRLPAWRGAYAADPMGWHDRARKHFDSYALSQVISPAAAPVVMDTALHLARHLEKIGTGMFTSGYICRNPNGDIRPHHYDMNLVFIDQLMNHFNWTGDTAYVRKMWPLIERHLAWEKRNFDADDDGLYDAYCCIWASDALQYSGGGVTHSSAYNYRIFKTASELATLIGVDGSAYKKESEKILAAVNRELWMPKLGWYAEYKDLLGKKLVHPIPGIWTIYHAIDAKLPDAFQAYQATRYVDTKIPHIPVKAHGLEEDSLYLISTSNWQPYTWSVNNVALAENLHMSLAYWQASRPQQAYRLWRSALIESMFLGASPGGFQQLSFYDAIRGQLYRDFADPVGMAARTLVEGLFGVQPNALRDTLLIKPGYPVEWNHARLRVPDLSYEFKRGKEFNTYTIHQSFPRLMHLKLQLHAEKAAIEWIKADGKKISWRAVENSVGYPVVEIDLPRKKSYTITIRYRYNGTHYTKLASRDFYLPGDTMALNGWPARIQSIYDPQKVLNGDGKIIAAAGNKTIFVQLKEGPFTWWQALDFEVREPVRLKTAGASVSVESNIGPADGVVRAGKFSADVRLRGPNDPVMVNISGDDLLPGTTRVTFEGAGRNASADILRWDLKISPETKLEKIDLTTYYNEKVTNIFKQQYLSPRPTSPALQLPTQGIGNWCYPLTIAEISDSGLRAQAGLNNEIILPQGIPFSTPGDTTKNNIIFTSQWDNFPDSVSITLSGRSSHAYLLMAGSTNPMQSRLVNGEVRINYTDGTFEILPLKNPENWWPIEQDLMNNGLAFTTNAPPPLRYYLKKGMATDNYNDYITIRGFTKRGIDGGAATVLDLPLNIKKELKSIVVYSIANDVVVGLMSLTLAR